MLWFALACNPGPGGTDSAGGTGSTSTSSGGSSSSGATAGQTSTSGPASTSGPTTTAGEATGGETGGDGLDEYQPCPGGDECDLCVQTDEGSVCGPACAEYGPGTAFRRCPMSAVQWQSICPWDRDTPNVCLLMCGVDADCPADAMICVDCPEPYVHACNYLWVFAGELGPRMCVWPK